MLSIIRYDLICVTSYNMIQYDVMSRIGLLSSLDRTSKDVSRRRSAEQSRAEQSERGYCPHPMYVCTTRTYRIFTEGVHEGSGDVHVLFRL